MYVLCTKRPRTFATLMLLESGVKPIIPRYVGLRVRVDGRTCYHQWFFVPPKSLVGTESQRKLEHIPGVLSTMYRHSAFKALNNIWHIHADAPEGRKIPL